MFSNPSTEKRYRTRKIPSNTTCNVTSHHCNCSRTIFLRTTSPTSPTKPATTTHPATQQNTAPIPLTTSAKDK